MFGTPPNVLITGGARRIGRAIAEDLAASGYGVAIHANASIAEAEALAASLNERGGRAVALAADLLDVAAAQRLVDAATDALGGLQIVVQSASIFEDDRLGSLDWTRWERHLDIHVKAPVAIAERFARRLKGEGGLVVNIIDQRVLRPMPTHFSYSLSKSALWWATRTMAQALAPRVRVNAIGPGPTLPSPRQSKADFRAQERSLLLGHGPNLSEFGATVRYLWAAPAVTGQMIALDGGQHLAWQTPDVAGITE